MRPRVDDALVIADEVRVSPYVAASVEEALSHLVSHRGRAQVVAGRTSMPATEAAMQPELQLVDVSRICAMRRIVQQDDSVTIGGAVTYATLVESSLAQQLTPLLHAAASQMSAPDVGQTATLGGNIVLAAGNSEVCVALVALHAEAQIANLTGAQWLPVDSLFVRSGVSRIDSSAEILTMLRLPLLKAGECIAQQRARPAAPGQRSPLIMALLVTLTPDGQVASASVAMGSIVSPPAHVHEAEEALPGFDVYDPRTRKLFTEALGDWASERGMFGSGALRLGRAALHDLAQRAWQKIVASASRATMLSLS
jgi:xanthine dehydrogenase small subunit